MKKNLRLQHGFVLSEEDVSAEDAAKMWAAAVKFADEHLDELEEAEEDFKNGRGVLLDDALKSMGMSR